MLGFALNEVARKEKTLGGSLNREREQHSELPQNEHRVLIPVNRPGNGSVHYPSFHPGHGAAIAPTQQLQAVPFSTSCGTVVVVPV
jgi:hypothetical protein